MPNEKTPEPRVIGDENVERLLASYRPEVIDPEFVKQVQQCAIATAAGRPTATQIVPSRHETNPLKSSWIAACAMALTILMVVGWLAKRSSDYNFYRDGRYVWVDGKPYVYTPEDATARDANGNRKPLQAVESTPNPQQVALVDEGGLQPRPRVEVNEISTAKVGEKIVTGRGDRRRRMLPDGSQIYVNENASLKIEADRHISIESGEVFLEVSPVDKDHNGSTFVVNTPNRDVEAHGTKFVVNVNDKGTDVLVTQGKVKVSDFEQMIVSGQQLISSVDIPAVLKPVPQIAHALDWIEELMVDTDNRLVPESKHPGGSLVAVDPNGQQMKMSMRNYHIDVHIEDGFARTTVDQTYFNHLNSRLEGTFYFPLPPDASISRLAMYVNGKLMEGGMAERNHARNVFETIKHRSLDPALLEWVDGSTFKMRVFPLEGRQEKRIIISYTQRLESVFGRTQYRFPAGHHLEKVKDWSLNINVADASSWEWNCSSHDLVSAVNGVNLVLSTALKNERFDRDIVLTLNVRDQETSAERTRLSSFEHEGDRYLMVRYSPKLTAPERRERRDWIFLVDADGSRDPILARVQADIVRTILENAEHEDTFAILTAGTRMRAFDTESRLVSEENVEAANEFLDSTHLIGALDFYQALGSANAFAQNAEKPVIVHVGGGHPILGERENDKLLKIIREDVPYIGVGVGKRWNRQLMKSAASKTGGLIAQINPDESTRWRTIELLSALNTSRLLDIRIEGDGSDAKFLNFKDWCSQGEEICAVARYRKAEVPSSLKVSGTLDREPYTQSIDVASAIDSESAGYLPRFWAKLAIDDMVSEDAEAHKSEIIELSKSMYVMSPFTSLLVLEDEQMYAQYNVDRGRKDHWALYPCPENIPVVHEPVLVQQAEPKEPNNANSRPTPEEVFRTLVPHYNQPQYRTYSNLQGLGILSDGETWFSVGEGFDRGINGVSDFRDFFDANYQILHRPQRGLGRGFVNGRMGSAGSGLSVVAPIQIPATNWEDGFQVFYSRTVDGRLNRFGQTAFSDFDVTREHFSNQFERSVQLRGDQYYEFLSGIDRSGFDQHVNLWGLGAAVGYPGVRNYFGNDIVFSARADGEGVVQFGDRPVLAGFIPLLEQQLEQQLASSRFEHGFGEPMSRWDQFGSNVTDYITIPSELPGGTERTAIVESLDNHVSLNYSSEPLNRVVGEIAAFQNVKLTIDEAELKKSSIDVAEPVSINVEGVSLRVALSLLLDPHKLAILIEDDGVRITTPTARDNELFKQDIADLLLMYSPEPVEWKRCTTIHSNDGETKDRNLMYLNSATRMLSAKLATGSSAVSPSYLYPDLASQRWNANYASLVNFAPAFDSSRADILDVLERESNLDRKSKTGDVDARAKDLIEQARKVGWQTVKWQDRTGQEALTVTMNGIGHFRYARRLPNGLNEFATFDGTNLHHCYPELRLGTKRIAGRFLRSNFARLVPWYVSSVEDLADGADLRMIDRNVVAIIPHQNEATESERQIRQHLVFATDGSLAERQIVQMPSGKVLGTEVYSGNGSVKRFDDQGDEISATKLGVKASAAPEMNFDEKRILMLPMPIRSLDFVRRTPEKQPEDWTDENALRWVASTFLQDPKQLQNVVGKRFFARNDRRIGFYVLLMSSGQRWRMGKPVDLEGGTTISMNPIEDHPESMLAKFIASHMDDGAAMDVAADLAESDNRFIAQLARFKQLSSAWQTERKLPTDESQRQKMLNENFEFMSQCEVPELSFSLLRKMQIRLGNTQPHARIATAVQEIEKKGRSSYVVKYELARSLLASESKLAAAGLFVQLYKEEFDAGLLPTINQQFVDAIAEVKAPFSDGKSQGIRGLMEGAADQLIRCGRRGSVIQLARQCRQLGQNQLADDLIDRVSIGVEGLERIAITIAMADYFVENQQWDRADQILQPLLSIDEYRESAEMFRLAAAICEKGSWLARSIGYLEHAMELEYQNLPEQYNVESVRQNYVELFERYQRLARLIADPSSRAPSGLLRRAIKAADRWRSLETDMTTACNTTANFLQTFGQVELAWDYLTTPLALKPNEAVGWLNLATNQRQLRNFDLAGRAYKEAFESEATNAQILWDHAQMLEQTNRRSDALAIFRKIADGDWQRRFDSIKQRAKDLLKSD